MSCEGLSPTPHRLRESTQHVPVHTQRAPVHTKFKKVGERVRGVTGQAGAVGQQTRGSLGTCADAPFFWFWVHERTHFVKSTKLSTFVYFSACKLDFKKFTRKTRLPPRTGTKTFLRVRVRKLRGSGIKAQTRRGLGPVPQLFFRRNQVRKSEGQGRKVTFRCQHNAWHS